MGTLHQTNSHREPMINSKYSKLLKQYLKSLSILNRIQTKHYKTTKLQISLQFSTCQPFGNCSNYPTKNTESFRESFRETLWQCVSCDNVYVTMYFTLWQCVSSTKSLAGRADYNTFPTKSVSMRRKKKTSNLNVSRCSKRVRPVLTLWVTKVAKCFQCIGRIEFNICFPKDTLR